MPGNLQREFRIEMVRMRFRGDKALAERWIAWVDGNSPSTWDHIRRLWRTLTHRRK